MTAALAHTFLTALKAELEAQIISDPPPFFTIGAIHIGRWQQSPEDTAPVVTLHEGNPKDASRSGDQDWSHELLINTREMPCGNGQWIYRYTCQVQFFMTRTREDQATAQSYGRILIQWLRRKISGASLSLSKSAYNETHMEHMVVKIESHEGGGPQNSYISRSILFIEQQVYVGA